MNREQATKLADQAELIRQLAMEQLPTARLANMMLFNVLHNVTQKAMTLRDDIMAQAEEEKPEPEKPKKSTKRKATKKRGK